MANDQAYNNLFHQAVNMQYKFHDFTAGANHPDVHVLQNQIHQLIGDIRMRKNPQDLSYRINTIQHQISQSQHYNQPAMDYNHANYLRGNYEHMRQSLRSWQQHP